MELSNWNVMDFVYLFMKNIHSCLNPGHRASNCPLNLRRKKLKEKILKEKRKMYSLDLRGKNDKNGKIGKKINEKDNGKSVTNKNIKNWQLETKQLIEQFKKTRGKRKGRNGKNFKNRRKRK